VQLCAETVLKARGVLPTQVDYVEGLAGGESSLDEVEIRGLSAVYRAATPSTLLGSLRAQTGWLEGVNGLASLVRAVVCLAYQVRPAVRNWTGPKMADLWEGSAFYILPEALTWFEPEGNVGRRAGISLLGKDGTCGHILLAETETSPQIEPVMRDPGLVLLMVGGASAVEILQGVERIKTRLESGEALDKLAREAFAQVKAAAPAELAVILARNSTEALRELEFAVRGLPAAAEKGSDWQTPLGSYYTPRPLGKNSPVAFVYPGAFNSYLGAGKDLFALFPGLQKSLAQIAPVRSVLYEERLYPRSLAPLGKEQLDRLEAALLDDAFAMMSSGLSLSVMQTIILRDIFHLQPESAFGYSLGENSMLFAMGVWGDGVGTSRRLRESALFQTRLAGPQNAVREYWGLPPQTAAQSGQELWGNFLVMAAVERVEQALLAEPRVYLTHINTPRQVVIAGDPAACKRVIEGLKCSSLRAPFNYVLHCKAMESEYAALYDLHSWPVREKPGARLYSAADDQVFQWSEAEVARAVARDLCSRLDFPKLVETVYADGARIFIELGAGSNCSKWIEDTLRGRPFLSVSANRKGVDDASAILRVLARLASHGAAVNLDPLFV
jgi:PfaB family protein